MPTLQISLITLIEEESFEGTVLPFKNVVLKMPEFTPELLAIIMK